jgi:molecular chaperone GrpE (heat shock protein)
MSTEMKSFIEFLEKANDAERQHLRLEVEKLKRGESDWVAVLVRVMDHVYAIHAAGVRSGQRNVVQQLTQFQNACRDALRRVGLVPIEVEPGTPFDAEQHQLPEGETPEAGVKVAGTLATGYTLRGERVRPPLVQLEGQAPESRESLPEKPGDAPPSDTSADNPELPL